MTAQLLVVVHLTDPHHAAEQSDIAFGNGADGVFLINHYTGVNVLADSVEEVRSRTGESAWIGINPLGIDCRDAGSFVNDVTRSRGRVDGLWCDNARIDESLPVEEQRAAIDAQAARDGWPGLYFGGVAFKYQRVVEDLTTAARTASQLMDVVCTSGPGTGKPADPQKLAALRAGLDRSDQLAVASGVDIDNVDAQLDHCGWFLVATGVSDTYTSLNPGRIATLAERIHR